MQAPLKVEYKAIAAGQRVEMLVMSNRTDLSQIEDISEIFIPSREIWVNDYPYLRRDFFMEMSRRFRASPNGRSRRRQPREREPRRNREWDDD